MKDGWYWFRSDDETDRALYGSESGWEMVYVVTCKHGIRVRGCRGGDAYNFSIADMPGRYEGPIAEPRELGKYENTDPRCRYPYNPEAPLDYCWTYAIHVDGDPKYKDLESLCRDCEFWKPEEEKLSACPYCGGKAVLQDSAVIYHGKSYGNAWICENYPECDAYVGCHKTGNGDVPLGRLANAELREAKKRAHTWFDPIWKLNKHLTRSEAYGWLAEQLGIHETECHIGKFDVSQCERVCEVIIEREEIPF